MREFSVSLGRHVFGHTVFGVGGALEDPKEDEIGLVRNVCEKKRRRRIENLRTLEVSREVSRF